MRARVTTRAGETTEIEGSEQTIADLAADPDLRVEVLPDAAPNSIARPWLYGDAEKPTAQS